MSAIHNRYGLRRARAARPQVDLANRVLLPERQVDLLLGERLLRPGTAAVLR